LGRDEFHVRHARKLQPYEARCRNEQRTDHEKESSREGGCGRHEIPDDHRRKEAADLSAEVDESGEGATMLFRRQIEGRGANEE
jgi:hypothetical protein